MLKPSWKFGESKWYPYWGVDQYGSFSIPSELVLYQSYPESVVKQNEILIDEHEDVDQYDSYAIPFKIMPS